MKNLAALSAVLAPLAIVAVQSLAGCASEVPEDEASNGAISAGASTGLTLPVPGSTGNAISAADQATIVDAWVQWKHDFYDTQDGYVGYKNAAGAYTAGKPPAGGPTTPQYAEVSTVPCPAYFGELVCRFYAHMTSYQPVVPNVRGCFSSLANGALMVTTTSGTTRKGTYADVFDYCMYQDYDAVLGKRAAYNATEIENNKAAGKEVGVLQYMRQKDAAGSEQTNRIRAVFKFIMYTWYEPNTFAAADQARVIAAAYGKMGAPVPAARSGLSRHPETAAIITGLNDYFQGDYSLDDNTPPKPVKKPVPVVVPAPPGVPAGDAACLAQGTNQACNQCCDLVHKSAFQNVAKPLIACACAPAACAAACASTLCSGNQPDAACTACVTAQPSCVALAPAAQAACNADAECTAQAACSKGCDGKP